jgi:hypothetical protein
MHCTLLASLPGLAAYAFRRPALPPMRTSVDLLMIPSLNYQTVIFLVSTLIPFFLSRNLSVSDTLLRALQAPLLLAG